MRIDSTQPPRQFLAKNDQNNRQYDHWIVEVHYLMWAIDWPFHDNVQAPMIYFFQPLSDPKIPNN